MCVSVFVWVCRYVCVCVFWYVCICVCVYVHVCISVYVPKLLLAMIQSGRNIKKHIFKRLVVFVCVFV